jgi:hypothetical protein
MISFKQHLQESEELEESVVASAMELWNIVSSLKASGVSYEAMVLISFFTFIPAAVGATAELWTRSDDREVINRAKAIIKKIESGDASKDDLEYLSDYGQNLVDWLGGGAYRKDSKYINNRTGRRYTQLKSISYSTLVNIDAIARWAYRKLTGKQPKKIKISKSIIPQVKRKDA